MFITRTINTKTIKIELTPEELSIANTEFVTNWMVNTVQEVDPSISDETAKELGKKAYEIYCRGDGETEYECVEKVVNEYESKHEYKVELYFTTCTTAEAVTEINIMLHRAGYSNISESHMVSSTKADTEDDWFGDYNFVFETIIYDTKENINTKLGNVGMSFDIVNQV